MSICVSTVSACANCFSRAAGRTRRDRRSLTRRCCPLPKSGGSDPPVPTRTQNSKASFFFFFSGGSAKRLANQTALCCSACACVHFSSSSCAVLVPTQHRAPYRVRRAPSPAPPAAVTRPDAHSSHLAAVPRHATPRRAWTCRSLRGSGARSRSVFHHARVSAPPVRSISTRAHRPKRARFTSTLTFAASPSPRRGAFFLQVCQDDDHAPASVDERVRDGDAERRDAHGRREPPGRRLCRAHASRYERVHPRCP